MRRFFHITVLILLYLLITAKSCDNGEQAGELHDRNSVKHTRDSIKSVFQQDTMSISSLRAYEVAAKIKLSDFTDYLTILKDTSIAGPFREQAGKMIRGLFISENSLIRFPVPGENGRNRITVRQLIEEKGEYTPSGKILADSVRVSQCLRWSGDSVYAGQLRYSFIYNLYKPAKRPTPATANGTIEFFVKRHKKSFGTDTLMIWDLHFGDME